MRANAVKISPFSSSSLLDFAICASPSFHCSSLIPSKSSANPELNPPLRYPPPPTTSAPLNTFSSVSATRCSARLIWPPYFPELSEISDSHCVPKPFSCSSETLSAHCSSRIVGEIPPTSDCRLASSFDFQILSSPRRPFFL